MTDFPIIYNIHNEFHMLRHFETASTLSIERLLSEGFTEQELAVEKKLTGSRFHSAFANDLNTLISQFRHQPTTIAEGINGNLIFSAKFDEQLFPNGIGTQAVVPIECIPAIEQKRIEQKNIRGYQLSHLKVQFLPTTHECTMIVKPCGRYHQFITAFPGEPAQPIPSHTMEGQQYEVCVAYWKSHVFLEV